MRMRKKNLIEVTKYSNPLLLHNILWIDMVGSYVENHNKTATKKMDKLSGSPFEVFILKIRDHSTKIK